MNSSLTLVESGNDPIVILFPNAALEKNATYFQTNNQHESHIKETKMKYLKKTEKLSTDSQSVSVLSIQSVQKSAIIFTIPSMYVRDLGIQCQATVYEHGNQRSTERTKGPFRDVILSLQRALDKLMEYKENEKIEIDANYLTPVIDNVRYAQYCLGGRFMDNASIKPFLKKKASFINENYIQQIEPSTSDSIEKIGRTIQDTCQHFQRSCQYMEESCINLQNEKDFIAEKLLQTNNELERSRRNELFLREKLNEVRNLAENMGRKIDTCTESITNLEIHVNDLEKENMKLKDAKEERLSLINSISKATKEKERLHLGVQLLLLENEKYRVLLQIKNEKTVYLQSQLRRIENPEIIIGGGDTAVTITQDSSNSDNAVLSTSEASSALANHKEDFTKENLNENPSKSIIDLKNELRELFSQMKEQAEVSDSQIGAIEVQSSTWSSPSTDSK